ncbi:acyl-CoA dehydrogenase family protein [Antrihabitans stalactiti]|uniref:Acyl-CoA dehydrogenase n=1 Tax=Antrihabitans stalactiti TaxID=2584121 RepID=A0A848KDR4_9NOCA|nr:acyl-CoA dehydrogenase family protein [Antrihabitans stalactiti]NMN95896.1 acyl-CoA dehydrogenase [Antrihabitans stalactiti]
MDFALTKEQDFLRTSARNYLGKRRPIATNIVAAEQNSPNWLGEQWHELCELGWLDPDLELLDQVILAEETAAELLPGLLFSTVALSWSTLTAAGKLAELTTGLTRPAFAWAESERGTGLRSGKPIATALAADGTVTGRKVLVPDAMWADSFLVLADGRGGPSIVRVAASNALVRALSTSDHTRPLGTVEFERAPSTPLLTGAEVGNVLSDTELRAFVIAAAESLGIASRALRIGVEHARDRTQFGRPIGSYQGVSHALVDSHAHLELARSLTYWAATAVRVGDPLARAACAAAKSSASTAALSACENAIQVCGGLGMTWEHPLHRLYKRARWLGSFLVGESDLLALIAAEIV